MNRVGSEQLAALAGDGDEAAFELLVERHRPALVRVAGRRLARSGIDPEDVVQDALVNAHEALRRGFRPQDVSAWLHVIVRNGCVSALRRPRASVGMDALIEGRPGESVADTAERREELDAVVADIKALCPTQRAMMVGRELEGRSYSDLAATGATTVSAVKSLLVRGRLKLKARAAERTLGLGGLAGFPLGKAGAVLGCGAVGFVCLGSVPKIALPSPAEPAVPPPALVERTVQAPAERRPRPGRTRAEPPAVIPAQPSRDECESGELYEYGGCAR